jgi:hypothetical protein
MAHAAGVGLALALKISATLAIVLLTEHVIGNLDYFLTLSSSLAHSRADGASHTYAVGTLFYLFWT